MFFHVLKNGKLFTEEAGSTTVGKIGVMIYVGGSSSTARNMVNINGSLVETVAVYSKNSISEIDDLIKNTEIPYQFGAYVPLYDFKDENTTIKASLYKNQSSRTGSNGYALLIYCDDSISIGSKPPKDDIAIGGETYSFVKGTTRLIYCKDTYEHAVLSTDTSSDATQSRTQFNQCHIGVLQYNFPQKMFLDCDVSIDAGSTRWKVFIGQAADDSGLTCFAFDDGEVNDMVPYPSDDGWVYTDIPADETLWGIIYGDSQKEKKIYLGRYQDIFNAAPYPYGDAFLPSLGPFPIARYNSGSDKITQIFHGLPLNSYILPDTSLECNDLYGDIGTDFYTFKSLEITKNTNYKDGKFGNYMNLYKFNSKDSDYNSCIPKQAQWFKIAVFDSENGENNSLSGNYSEDKTMLIREENGNYATLEYNFPVLDVQSLSSHLSSVWYDYWGDVSANITCDYHWDCENLRGCEDVLSDILSGKFTTPYDLSTNCWLQGAGAGTNYGSSIGNSTKGQVINLNSCTLESDGTGGQWGVKGGFRIIDNDLIINNGSTIYFDGNSNWPKFIINGIPFGPKTIVDGNGVTQLVLGQITT